MLNIAYKHTYKNMDRGLLEFLGPNGLSNEIYKFTKGLSNLSIGFIFHYLFIFFFCLFIFLFCFGG